MYSIIMQITGFPSYIYRDKILIDFEFLGNNVNK